MTTGSDNKNMKDKVTLSWNTNLTPQRPQTATTARAAARIPAPAEKPAQPAAQPQAAPAPQPEPEEKPQTDAAPQEPAVANAPASQKKSGCAAAILDTLLVILLLGTLGGGAWYMHQQMEQYRVPSPLELAQAEHLELCKQHEQLQDAAYKADEQLHMRQRIDHLDLQLAEVKRQLAEHKQGIEVERGRIASLQREIRQEDKTSRGVARNLLIGLPVGNVSTTNGRVYPNAIIHRLEAGRITLRTPHGQVRFPVSQLVKDNLPDMARYAFGIDDMVDMADFETSPGEPATKKQRKGKIISPRKVTALPKETSYEPESGAPVVDASAQPGSMQASPAPAPEGEQPLEP